MPNADKIMKTSLYKDLRKLANVRLQRHPNRSLQPTELVNDVYIRLAKQEDKEWAGRTEYFRAAAHVMKLVIIDKARQASAQKRPPRNARVDFTVSLLKEQAPAVPERLLALHDALERMGLIYPQHAEIVILRYFGGLTVKETMETLGITKSQVHRKWRFARAWLKDDMSRQDDS